MSHQESLAQQNTSPAEVSSRALLPQGDFTAEVLQVAHYAIGEWEHALRSTHEKELYGTYDGALHGEVQDTRVALGALCEYAAVQRFGRDCEEMPTESRVAYTLIVESLNTLEQNKALKEQMGAVVGQRREQLQQPGALGNTGDIPIVAPEGEEKSDAEDAKRRRVEEHRRLMREAMEARNPVDPDATLNLREGKPSVEEVWRECVQEVRDCREARRRVLDTPPAGLTYEQALLMSRALDYQTSEVERSDAQQDEANQKLLAFAADWIAGIIEEYATESRELEPEKTATSTSDTTRIVPRLHPAGALAG